MNEASKQAITRVRGPIRASGRAPNSDLGGKGRDSRKEVPCGDLMDLDGRTHQEKVQGQNIPGRRPVKSEELGSSPDATINSLALR